LSYDRAAAILDMMTRSAEVFNIACLWDGGQVDVHDKKPASSRFSPLGVR